MKHVKGKLTAALGLAAGYVLGSRAGRDRYEKIKSTAEMVKDKVAHTKDSPDDPADEVIRPS